MISKPCLLYTSVTFCSSVALLKNPSVPTSERVLLAAFTLVLQLLVRYPASLVNCETFADAKFEVVRPEAAITPVEGV